MRQRTAITIAIPIVVLAGLGLLVYELIPRGTGHYRYEDTGNLRQLQFCVLELEAVPTAADGRVDVYAALLDEVGEDPDEHELRMLVREDQDEVKFRTLLDEVRRGDYTRFGWKRAIVANLVPGAKQPLIWDPAPHEGKRLVAYSDGNMNFVDERDFREPR